MTKPENPWEENLLHIIAQDDCHADASIWGTPLALKRLGQALIEASETGREIRLSGFLVKDGEGYEVAVFPQGEGQMMASAPRPYAQPGMPWELEPAKWGAYE
jgi:hypothetical protein